VFAIKAQRSALEGLASKEMLARTAPRAGKTLWWGLGLSALIVLMTLGAVFAGLSDVQPVWLTKLAALISPAA
jgi:hypothetical protein